LLHMVKLLPTGTSHQPSPIPSSGDATKKSDRQVSGSILTDLLPTLVSTIPNLVIRRLEKLE
jgi:hypothetical protein